MTPQSAAKRDEAMAAVPSASRKSRAASSRRHRRRLHADDATPGWRRTRQAVSNTARRSGPTGVYGRWLRDKDIAAIVNGSLFMHAGLNPARPAPKSIDEVNDQVRAEVKRLDAFRKRLVDKRIGLALLRPAGSAGCGGRGVAAGDAGDSAGQGRGQGAVARPALPARSAGDRPKSRSGASSIRKGRCGSAAGRRRRRTRRRRR